MAARVIWADLDELVFRTRNRAYGAYDLRKRYVKHLLRALLIGWISFTIAVTYPIWRKWIAFEEEETVVEKKRKITYAELGEPPPINKEEEPPPPPEIEPPKPPKRAKIKFVPPKVEKDEKVENIEQTIVDIDTLQKIDPGLETQEGDPNAIEDIDFDVEGTGGDEPVEIVEEKPKDPDPFEFVAVEKQPQPVNLDDIKQRIGYPEQARQAHIEGKVVVRILVDENGRYVKHIVIKKAHPILVRAVEKEIPNLIFTPGIQSGKPIRVWVNIPFVFRLRN